MRPITSFDWSPSHPYLLATSSADQFRAICVWDVRDLTRPARAIESLCRCFISIGKCSDPLLTSFRYRMPPVAGTSLVV